MFPWRCQFVRGVIINNFTPFVWSSCVTWARHKGIPTRLVARRLLNSLSCLKCTRNHRTGKCWVTEGGRLRTNTDHNLDKEPHYIPCAKAPHAHCAALFTDFCRRAVHWGAGTEKGCLNFPGQHKFSPFFICSTNWNTLTTLYTNLHRETTLGTSIILVPLSAGDINQQRHRQFVGIFLSLCMSHDGPLSLQRSRVNYYQVSFARDAK